MKNQLHIPVVLGGKELRLPVSVSGMNELYRLRAIVHSKALKLKASRLIEFIVSEPALLLLFTDRIRTIDKRGLAKSIRKSELPELTRAAIQMEVTHQKATSKYCKHYFKRLAEAQCNKDVVDSLYKFASMFLVESNRSNRRLLKEYLRSWLPLMADDFCRSLSKAAQKVVDGKRKPIIFGEKIAFLLGEQSDAKRRKDAFEAELLERKLESMKLLAYGASHEINNPLANISTRAQALLQDETDAGKRRRLGVIYEQAIRAHEMISDMMLFAHPPPLSLEMTDLENVVHSVAKDYQSELAEQNIRLKLTTESVLLRVDSTKIASALSALIRNALESLNPEGKIRIKLKQQKSHVSLQVDDNGRGIDEQIEQNIFDPFFSGREAGRGLGFGLSKAWRVAQMHNATLTWRRKSKGVCFEFRFPINVSLHIEDRDSKAA